MIIFFFSIHFYHLPLYHALFLLYPSISCWYFFQCNLSSHFFFHTIQVSQLSRMPCCPLRPYINCQFLCNALPSQSTKLVSFPTNGKAAETSRKPAKPQSQSTHIAWTALRAQLPEPLPTPTLSLSLPLIFFFHNLWLLLFYSVASYSAFAAFDGCFWSFSCSDKW